MKVVVLGAGLLGVTSAWFLRQLGHEVVVIDRQASAAAETSFANGGQISVSHAEPWANPGAPIKVLKYNIEQIVRLGTYSRDTLQQLRRDTGLEYDQRTQGILHFYTNPREFDAAEAPAAQMRALGCDRRVISADEAVRIEPALAHIRPQLAGATYTAEDESGDANRFARELVALCEQSGVVFRTARAGTLPRCRRH